MIASEVIDFAITGSFKLQALPARALSDCFADPLVYSNHDMEMHSHLPVIQHATDACVATILAPWVDRGYHGTTARFLWASTALSGQELGNLLIERDHVLTLPQMEEIAERVVRGSIPGIDFDTDGIFAFTRTGDVRNPVAMIHMHLIDGQSWNCFSEVISDESIFAKKNRLVVRNYDASHP